MDVVRESGIPFIRYRNFKFDISTFQLSLPIFNSSKIELSIMFTFERFIRIMFAVCLRI
jgi:hypothetical protein